MLKEIWEQFSMKTRYGIFFMLGMLFCGVIWLASCESVERMIESYKDDNIIEEIVEEVIEQKTGLEIDLTPTTLE